MFKENSTCCWVYEVKTKFASNESFWKNKAKRFEKIKQRRKRIKGKNAIVEGLDLITPTNYCFAAEKLEMYAHFFTHKKKEDFLKDNNDYLENFKKKFKV